MLYILGAILLIIGLASCAETSYVSRPAYNNSYYYRPYYDQYWDYPYFYYSYPRTYYYYIPYRQNTPQQNQRGTPSRRR